jgi:leucyl/phenylalanyl-tRNA--protein transferase
MQAAYHALFQMGYATAIAVWDHNDLIGGLYGVSIGQMLYGESMFSARTGGSKIALAAAQWLMQQQVWQLIDAQVVSPHLLTLGAQAISREAFISSMTAATAAPKVNRQEIFSNEACLDALIRTDAT